MDPLGHKVRKAMRLPCACATAGPDMSRCGARAPRVPAGHRPEFSDLGKRTGLKLLSADARRLLQLSIFTLEPKALEVEILR